MIKTIIMFWNANSGDGQPGIVTLFDGTDTEEPALDDLPNHTYGIFDFGDSTTVYDAIMEVIERLGLSVVAGGAGEQYGLFFSDFEGISASAIRLIITAQGRPTSNIVLGALGIGKTGPPMHITEIRSPQEGHTVIVKGKPGTGSYPREPALWRSLVEEYDSIPLWNEVFDYKKDAYAAYNNEVFKRLFDTRSGPHMNPELATSEWDPVTFQQYIKDQTGIDEFQYSPWTNNRSGAFKTFGGNPENPLASNTSLEVYDSFCFPDQNLVIRDAIDTPGSWRDWVDVRVSSVSAIPAKYLLDGKPYHGLRVLNTGGKTWEGDEFDKLGHPYDNAMIMLDRDGDWLVFRNPIHFDECTVMSEGRIYAWNSPHAGEEGRRLYNRGTGTIGWRDLTEVPNGNDCFHYPNVLENAQGLIGNTNDDPKIVDSHILNNSRVTVEETKKFSENSAIRVRYTIMRDSGTEQAQKVLEDFNTLIKNILPDYELKNASDGLISGYLKLEDAAGLALPPETPDDVKNKLWEIPQYNNGWWVTLFESPFPKTTDHGNKVGALFKRPVLDLYNLNYTPSGKSGYGHEDSDMLGPLDGIKMLFRFKSFGFTARWANIPMRCVMYDLIGGTWIQDINARFRDYTIELDFPFSGFSVYRARRPEYRTISSSVARIINPELRITELFERRLIKRITLQSMIGYTDDGAYAVWDWGKVLASAGVAITGIPTYFEGMFDALHFTKTPVAIEKDDNGSLDLEAPIYEYPNISNVAQLQKIAKVKLDLAKFQANRFSISFESFVKVSPGMEVITEDDEIIPALEFEGSNPHTIALIIAKVTYSVGDANRASGRRTDIELFRKLGDDRHELR